MSNKQFQSAFELAQEKVRALITNHPGYYPMYTVNGKWKHGGETWTHWCDGFLPGQMWIFYEKTRSPYWLEKAIEYSKPLEPRQFDRNVHDLGFIFFSTYLRWLETVEDSPRQQLEDVLIQAGNTMSLRFKEKGQYLRSFVADESLFIDIMMNVNIIFYAAKLLSERGQSVEAAELGRIAHAHCRTSLRTLVRGDGSTAHEAIFNPETGECLRQTTHQGYRGDSGWSRGLAWSAYGFCMAYKFTGVDDYLDISRRCAKFYIEHTPEDGVAQWDYDAPEASRKQPDSSAAAIMASALQKLSRVCSGQTAVEYDGYFRRIMETLVSMKYLAHGPAWEGILKHGVYHIHKDLGVDESVMWGEYFFVEALSKLLSK